MNADEIHERLTSVLRQELRRPDLQVGPHMIAQDVPGWDSAATVSIILAVEDEFGFEMKPSDLRNIRGVADLAKIIARQPA